VVWILVKRKMKKMMAQSLKEPQLKYFNKLSFIITSKDKKSKIVGYIL